MIRILANALNQKKSKFECYGLWLLKNSLTQNCSKKLCARRPYKRLSPFSGHFLSLNFWLFGGNQSFSTATPVFVSCLGIVLPVEHAAQCRHMTDELSWLQRWYLAHCDGE
jgi:hypothetical protein